MSDDRRCLCGRDDPFTPRIGVLATGHEKDCPAYTEPKKANPRLQEILAPLRYDVPQTTVDGLESQLTEYIGIRERKAAKREVIHADAFIKFYTNAKNDADMRRHWERVSKKRIEALSR